MMKRGKLAAAALVLLAAGILWYFTLGSVTVDGTRYFRYVQELDLSGRPLEQAERLTDFPQLRFLDLRGTGISNEEGWKLRQALPECEIHWEVYFQNAYRDADTLELEIEALQAQDLPQLQYQILCNAAAYLKQGGCLVYSTCTVLPQENEAVVQRFLKEHPELSLEGFELPVAGKVPEGMVTLYPHRHGTDGFFIAKLRKA